MDNLRLIVMENIKDFGEKVNSHLKNMLGTTKDLIVPIDEVRFNNGEGKIVLKESVRKKDIFILTDPMNHSITYKMYDYYNHKSPDDHFVDVIRVLCAIRNQANSTSLVMPFLYASRQHKREGRESLDCAISLQEYVHQGVKNIITFDVHDSNVQNAIPASSFDNFYPTNILLEKFITAEDVNNNNLLAVSPDNGALKRTRFYANMLGCELGGHFEKHRDLYKIVDGKNPILEHEYIGKPVDGKDIIIVDDMIASGESMLDVARELKKRGAKRIYLFSSYAMFTKGVDVFENAYEEGMFTKLFATNLSYIPKEALEKPWIEIADCSEYLAKIIYTFHIGGSVSPILEARSKVLEEFAKNETK